MNKPKKKGQVRSFADDRRKTNPGLHNMYVRSAYEVLSIANEAKERLEGLSQVTATIMAGALQEAMRTEIEDSAAYFEAAALLFAGLEPPAEEGDNGRA